MLVISNPDLFRVPLSFNVIAGNVPPVRFQRMMESIAPVADHIAVVFDETAPDSLYDIAHRHRSDIATYRWIGDFAYQRNNALEMTRRRYAGQGIVYVAWTDTDEWVRQDVGARIRNLMTAPRMKAFYLWQGSPSRTGGLTLVPQIRIFPLVDGVRWEIPAHEQILPSLKRVGIQTEVTDLRIEHSGYWNDREVAQKNRRNLAILRKRVQTNPEDTFSQQNYQNALQYDRLVACHSASLRRH
jgi:hypothetical protein